MQRTIYYGEFEARVVYDTQDASSSMKTARMQQEEEIDTRITVQNKEESHVTTKGKKNQSSPNLH